MAEVERKPVKGIWWRHSAAGIDALSWQDPPADARWQRGQITGAIYLADSPETAWAEFYRFLAEAGLPPRKGLPRDLSQVSIDVAGIADLSTRVKLSSEGLDLPSPAGSQWPRFQSVGEEQFMDGAAGLIAPSAARPEGLVLCLFRQGPIPAGLRVENVERFDDPPNIPRGFTT